MNAGSSASGPVILVAALDWGLGHATRCFPIIRRLQQRGCAVHLAGSGASGVLLRDSFPELPFHSIPAHEVRYARSGRLLLWKLALQLPRLAATVAAEHRWLQDFLQKHTLGAVISDNRYGLHHSSVPSVFITHQLSLRTPFGAAGDALMRRYHYRLIGRFGQCWVPDGPAPGLAGALAHPPALPPVPTRYIGPLSRLQPAAATDAPYELVVLLSGPEPQRSIWEAQLLPQLALFGGRTLLVRGLPAGGPPIDTPANVAAVPHLASDPLQAALSGAGMVVARCGYSTVMDLAALGRPAILVPTPGQPEQEYLATHLSQNGFAYCVSQDQFDLRSAIGAVMNKTFHKMPAPNDQALDEAIDGLLQCISAR